MCVLKAPEAPLKAVLRTPVEIQDVQQCFSILAAHWAALSLLIPYPITRNSDLTVLECALAPGIFRALR